MHNIQLIVPMSGIGKRFLEAGYGTPKPLIPVDGKPIIEHVVNLFPGVTDVSFICNEEHLSSTNMSQILSDISPGCKIFTVSSTNRKGPVDAVQKIFEHISDDKAVIVSYCDYGTQWNFEKFLKEIKDNKYDGAVVCYRGFHPHMLGGDNYAFVKCNEDGTLQKIKEKQPFTDNRMEEFASNGTYYFSSGKILKHYFQKAIDLDLKTGHEFYVSMVYNLLADDGLKVGVFEIEKMLQWGTPHDLAIYNSWSAYFSNIIKPQKLVKNPPNTSLVLPMAGRGSRFKVEGFNAPKPLLPVNEQPMIIQAVNCLPQTDNKFFICLNEHVKEFEIDKILRSNYPTSNIISISEVTQGQACTCEIAVKQNNICPEDPIFISACDNGVYYDAEKYQELLNDESNDVIVWSFRNNHASKSNPDMYAWLDVDNNGLIRRVSCKKFIYDDPIKTHAIIGTMFFRKTKYFMEGLQKNYEINSRVNGEFYVDDVLNRCIEAGLKVRVFEVLNYICWGTPDDYKTYQYWQEFFNDCWWHPYKKEKDTTYFKSFLS